MKDQAGVETMIHTYHNRGAFGELALLYNMPRAASIKATTPGTLWAMDRQTFRRILLKSAYRKRKMYEDLINKVPMLKSLEVNFTEFITEEIPASVNSRLFRSDIASSVIVVQQRIKYNVYKFRYLFKETVGWYFRIFPLIDRSS